ncbi:MAG: PP2C family protein-serine/threonine phosphatase [Planctomycetota bacterium]|jgi:serine phosphatase RsbU (regulator of sigma subunit)
MEPQEPEPSFLPDNPWFSPEELRRFAECLTGDSDRDQRCFKALLTTVSEVLGATDLDELLCRLVDHTVQTTGTERGILLLRRGDNLKVRVARDRTGRDLGPAPVLSRCVPQRVLGENKAVLARVSGESEVLDLTHSVTSMRLRQVMCAPVRARGKTLGVIYVDSTFSGPAFTSADLTTFYVQAGLMGMAIENNRLFNETIQAREMSHQLRVARDIQKRLLPETPMKLGRTELAGSSEASNRVGGDYFDYFLIDAERVGLSVGDVSGHGIGPALIMSNVRAHLRTLLQTKRSLSGLYGLMNRALCADLTDGMFVSLFVGVYHPQKKVLEFQNAGHTAPLLYRPTKDKFRGIAANAPALGIIDDISAGPCPSVPVQKGDILVCYTDGVTERHNPEGELYGEERLQRTVRSAVRAGGSPAEIVEAIKEDCEAHAQHLPPRDDVTLIVAKF